jgi:hypothetical protein
MPAEYIQRNGVIEGQTGMKCVVLTPPRQRHLTLALATSVVATVESIQCVCGESKK